MTNLPNTEAMCYYLSVGTVAEVIYEFAGKPDRELRHDADEMLRLASCVVMRDLTHRHRPSREFFPAK